MLIEITLFTQNQCTKHDPAVDKMDGEPFAWEDGVSYDILTTQWRNDQCSNACLVMLWEVEQNVQAMS